MFLEEGSVFSSSWHLSQFGRLGWQVNLGMWCLDEPQNTSWCYELCASSLYHNILLSSVVRHKDQMDVLQTSVNPAVVNMRNY